MTEADGGRPPIIPTPAASTLDVGEFVVDATTVLSVSDPALLAIAERFHSDLVTYAGVTVAAPVVEPAASPGSIRLEIEELTPLRRPTRGVRADGAPMDVERHRLTVTETGVRVVGHAAEGVQRGVTTLLQTVAAGSGVVLRAGRVDDAPELAWRGLSLDVVRWFVPVAEIKRVIDVLALYKFNVLHLHLTDNEGWRLEIEGWPALTEDRTGDFYTRDDLHELVTYANERFVTVLPEVDLPGHTAAVLEAYPHLGVLSPADGASPMRVAHLDPHNDDTWRFVDDVLRSVASISPAHHLHLGGDEAFGMDPDDYVDFVDQAIARIRGLGKGVVGWQETCRAGVGPEDVVQHWIDFAGLAEGDGTSGATDQLSPEALEALTAHFREAFGDLRRIADKGSRLLLSPTSTFYLDQPHGDPSVDEDQEADRGRLGLQLYPRRTLEAMVTWDLDAAAAGVDPDAVAGVEAALWCETVESVDDLELLLLPRIAGVAELAWGPSDPVAWSAHRQRLAAHARLWQRAGWSWFRAASVDWAA